MNKEKSKNTKNKRKSTDNVERPNKSQLKRDMESLREQAAYICELKAQKVVRLELNPGLLDAIEELKRIKSPNAKNRHIQFITRLLSEQSNLESIHQVLFEYQNPHLQQQQVDRKVDSYSEKILEKDDVTSKTAIEEILNHPQLPDRQNFLQILRNAQKEFSLTQPLLEDTKPLNQTPLKQGDGKHTKKLKKLLREILKP